MKKLICVLFSVALFLLFTSNVSASLIVISPQGEIVWKVLSKTSELDIPQRQYLEIRELAASADYGPESKVLLAKSQGKSTLSVTSEDGEKSLDVSGLEGSLVEIEERPQTKLVKIGTVGEQFSIEEGGYVALTDFPITIDPSSAELSVETTSGTRFIAVLPGEAVDSLIKAKVNSKVEQSGGIFLQEQAGKDLAYQVSGKKVINLFNLYSFEAPVSAQVSALTGEIISTQMPAWLRVLGFMFS